MGLYFDSDVPEINVFHADNMDDVNCHYVDVYNVNGNTETKKVKLKEALSDDEKEETLNSLVENNKKEKFNENIPKIGGFLAGEELFERQANAKGFEEEVIVITE